MREPSTTATAPSFESENILFGGPADSPQRVPWALRPRLATGLPFRQ
jgi:hypothetical protein